ncbi:ATP synthase F1 subunit epsilon [Buchnera aphidicola]|uniref:ATP synthase epsilon chain n=1 Tax=Buchnera aphidicola (Anoecia oenotherae) TaxID=1241833 RepID=A0A4D6XQ38_9GAMM|nr:ATP synthase F1 subunit epsilon [Buchnera aphidicola]QCI19153.1 ATP synthase F1 subunit epsilon [Buchnera aphidicola (Anoecia oenotherae)]
MELHLNLVSMTHKNICEKIKSIKVPGIEGGLNIYPQHTPLLTTIKPGIISITKSNNTIKNIYISSGILEVQPFLITILGKTVLQKKDIDAEKTKKNIFIIKKYINNTQLFSKKIKMLHELEKQLAQLKLLNISNI